MKRLGTVFFSILLIAAIPSCKKDKDSIFSTNKNPIANAGPDQVCYFPKDSVLLNGSLSTDADGSIVKYSWKQVSGPSATVIVNASNAETVVRSLVLGQYLFQLTVTDNKGASNNDTVRVTVQLSTGYNYPPNANAGPDQTITWPTNSCILFGAYSFDPDGIISSYSWTKIAGPAAFLMLSPAEAVTEVINMEQGSYQFQLEVIDDKGERDRDTVTVLVTGTESNCGNNRPTINVSLTQIGTLSEARAPVVAAAAGKIVFAGGFKNYQSPGYDVSSAVDIYDVNTNTWSTAQLSLARRGMTAVSLGNKIYFAGGGSSEGEGTFDNVDVYDAVTNTWTLENMSEGRCYLTAAVAGSRIFFAGGLTAGYWEQSKTVDIYDTLTGLWSKANLSQEKFDLYGITHGNSVYFAGGWNWYPPGGPYNTIDIYNTGTNQWATSQLNTIAGSVSAASKNNYIYWGGISATDPNLGLAEIWNTSTNTVDVQCLSYARNNPQVVSYNESIIFFTSGPNWQNNFVFTNKVDIYNTVTNTWSVGVMNKVLTSAAIISYGSKVYVAGGIGNGNTMSNKVYELSF